MFRLLAYSMNPWCQMHRASIILASNRAGYSADVRWLAARLLSYSGGFSTTNPACIMRRFGKRRELSGWGLPDHCLLLQTVEEWLSLEAVHEREKEASGKVRHLLLNKTHSSSVLRIQSRNSALELHHTHFVLY